MSPKLEQKRRQPKPQEEEPAAVEAVVDAEAERLKATTDELLDEIDSVLEVNAEEFVSHYIQKGGQ